MTTLQFCIMFAVAAYSFGSGACVTKAFVEIDAEEDWRHMPAGTFIFLGFIALLWPVVLAFKPPSDDHEPE